MANRFLIRTGLQQLAVSTMSVIPEALLRENPRPYLPGTGMLTFPVGV